MTFQKFELENRQSDHEQTLRFNLADSTVDPVTVADEVYRGSGRLTERETSFVGMTDRVVGVGSLSKSYGLSGLRIGWAVCTHPEPRHEYVAIATGRLDNHLAECATTAT